MNAKHLLWVVLLSTTCACAWAAKGEKAGGGGGSRGETLTLSFAADRTAVSLGSPVLLLWASAGAKSCEASGAWSGRKPLSGSERTSALTTDSTFSLTCRAGSSQISRMVIVDVDASTAPVAAPSVVFYSDVTSVEPDGTTTLRWESRNASSCSASQAWSGSKAVTGSELVGPLSSSASFTLTCSGDGGSTSASVAIAVEAPIPKVSLTVDRDVVAYQESVKLTWSSSHAEACTAGGGWSGTKSTSGSQSVGPITGSTTFSLKCDNGSGSAYSAVTVALQSDTSAPDATSPGTIGDGRLDAIIDAIRAKHGTPALAAVVTRNGQIAESTASGVRYLGSTEPVTLQDRWHIGSLSKAITGTLIGVHVESGTIGWQTRPRDVWPNLAIRSDYRDATLAHLLTHRSGLPRNAFDVPSIKAIYDSAPGTVREKRLLLAQELLGSAPEASPGTFHYSNSGYIVAAAMLETLADAAWEDLLRTQLLDPLGMMNTASGAPGVGNPYGHKTTSDGLVPVPPGPSADVPFAMTPAMGLHTTLADYSAFMLDHIAGSRGQRGIVSPSTYDYLHTGQTSNGYAIGWYVWSNGILEHSGSNTKWRARTRLIPYLDVGILVVANAADDAANAASEDARELLTERAKATR